MKGCKDYRKREDAVENLLPDDSSSDENIDCNMVTGGTLSLCSFFASYLISLFNGSNYLWILISYHLLKSSESSLTILV